MDAGMIRKTEVVRGGKKIALEENGTVMLFSFMSLCEICV